MRTDGWAGSSGGLGALLESLSSTPVIARDRHLTVVAANAPARALSPAFQPGVNLLRWLFLSEERHRCDVADELPSILIALLKDSLEQHDEDARFRALVGELVAQNSAFARMWADDARPSSHGGVAGRTTAGITLRFQELRLVDDFEVVLVVLYEDA